MVTGLNLTIGQTFTVSSSANDLWSAGDLPRYSDGSGLSPVFALRALRTTADNPSEPRSARIGGFGPNTPSTRLSAAWSAKSRDLFLIGANYTGQAIASGALSLYYWDSNKATTLDPSPLMSAAVPGPIVGAGLPGLVMALVVSLPGDAAATKLPLPETPIIDDYDRPPPGGLLLVRPAWAHSCGCKSHRELITTSEAKRNCMRATECGKEAWSEAAGR